MKNIMQKNSVAGSGSSSSALSMGLVCCYQPDKRSSQFSFLRIGNRDGISVNHQLSFSTNDHVRFVSSCNGLLLLMSRKKKEFIYHVFNPLTMENFSLPKACVTGLVLRSGLAVDEHQNYQVVLLHLSAGLELDVFSSETGKWKRLKPINLFLPLPVKDMFPKLTAPPLFSNGAIHWEILGHLLVYNVHNYHCKLIELPFVNDKCCSKSKMNFRGSFWESEGRVHYSYTDTDGVHAWYLLNEHDLDCYSKNNNIDCEKFNWGLADSLDLQTLRKNYPDVFKHWTKWKPDYLSPFAYNESSQTMFMQLPGLVISYNRKTGALEEVCSFKLPGKELNRRSFFPFVYGNGEYSLETIDATSEEKKVVKLPTTKVVSYLPF